MQQVIGRSSCRRANCGATFTAAPRAAPRCRKSIACDPKASATAITSAAEDKWIAKNIVAPAATQDSLSKVRQGCSTALSTLRMPTTRNEEYRFTDISPIIKSSFKAASAGAAVDTAAISSRVFKEAASSYAVVVDGVLRPELSQLSGVPQGVYVGGLQGAPADVITADLGSQSNARGGPFSVINGATAQDALCIVVPAGMQVSTPVHVLYIATGGSPSEKALVSPRLLVRVGEGSTLTVLEEFCPASGTAADYFTCAVAELSVQQNAYLTHSYVQDESRSAFHMRSTLVRQEQHSTYEHTHASLGCSLARQDLGIEQAGPETHTEMKHFLLSGSQQTQDLHSQLELNHPQGTADQQHKCIVSHATGRGVFDGNVKVNKYAQKTDASQLSRNLLLVPRATVNVKPNLQIIADDVKCTHGCAVSDLSEEELFYFRARGINASAAREALVKSFGASVIQHIKFPQVIARLQQRVAETLSQRPDAALATNEDDY